MEPGDLGGGVVRNFAIDGVLNGLDWRGGADCGGADSGGVECAGPGGRAGGEGVSTQDSQSIENAVTEAGADLQLVQSLIAQYKNADASAQPGILSHIHAALDAIRANLNGILPALHIEDPATRSKVAAVVGVVLSEVESLAAIVPLISTAASPQDRTVARAAGKNKPPLAASDFVRSYNATMTAKTGNAALDRASSRLEIHIHGKLARWATAGWLK